jgi:hypothetical protein
MGLHLLVDTFHNGRNAARKRCLMENNELALKGAVLQKRGEKVIRREAFPLVEL